MRQLEEESMKVGLSRKMHFADQSGSFVLM